jgi:succinyl-diaminopimelate desuccinylase
MNNEHVPVDPAAVLADLIRCPSVTPAEGGALSYLEKRLKTLGFRTERLVFSDKGTPDVDNLFATVGSGAPHLLFAGHSDVVPTGDESRWRVPPFEGRVVDGQIYGRGAVDMKGAIACFVAAAAETIAKGMPRGTLSFLITGDEEGPAVNGTAKVLRWAREHGHNFDAALIGEPSNSQAIGDSIKVGRRGSLSGTIFVTGKQGHSAYPHLADNPIPRIVAMASALISTPLDAGSDAFQPSHIEITSIDTGNPAFNVIPAAATMRFNVRFNDHWTFATLDKWLRERLDAAAGGKPYRLDYEPLTGEAFLTKAPELTETLIAAIREAAGRSPTLSTAGGTSDARFVKDYCPVVEFGLVGATMHQTDERVPLADLSLLTRVYARFLALYFARGA